MTHPQGGPDSDPGYVPPTSTSQAHGGHPQQAYGQHPGYPAPPPGYAVAYAPAKPQQLGLAAGCTLAVGILGILAGVAVLIGALFMNFAFGVANMYAEPWSGPVGRALMGVMLVVAIIPLVFGAIGISAGAGLNSGRRSAWTSAVVVHVMSLIVGAITFLAGGLGLLHVIPSGIGLWALYQPEMKAYFGH